MINVARWIALAFLLASPLACERAPETDRAARTTTADAATHPVEVEPGISLAVRKTGSREYTMYGRTDRADEIRLSVEDGHNVLFGPTLIAVDNERFRIDLIVDPTERDHIFFYVTDDTGGRLAVVPVDTARAMTVAGPEADLPEPPELGAPGR